MAEVGGSALPALMAVLEAREGKAAADRRAHDERYLRRTQRLYDYHERQRRCAAEVRRCAEGVSARAAALEAALRGGEVPLGGALLRQAAALQRCMARCLHDAANIRPSLAAHKRPQMDAVLAKMETELNAWTAFLQRAVDAAHSHELVLENLHNMIAEQRRCVREVSSSTVLTALCGPAAEAEGPTAEPPEPADEARTPPARSAPPGACSTPIARD